MMQKAKVERKAFVRKISCLCRLILAVSQNTFCYFPMPGQDFEVDKKDGRSLQGLSDLRAI